MREQSKKAPCSIALLAHVDAGRGAPHINSPEKLDFLGAVLHFWNIWL